MNPELRRNLWLELTLHRVVALPVGLVLAFMLAYSWARDDPNGSLATTAVTFFIGFALWGAMHAGDAVIGEVRARTWDGQRMSAIEPWTMTWGKLVGAPAFAWLGALLCLFVFVLFSPSANTFGTMLFLLSGAVLVQALALNGSVVAARRGFVRNTSSIWIIVLAFMIVGPWMSVLTSSDADIVWWGRGWKRIDFMLVCTALFAGWAVFGAHRMLCEELRVRTLPWAWVAFIVYVASYIAGFGIRPNDTLAQQKNVVLIAGMIVSLAAMYPMLLSEVGGAMAVRRLLLRASNKEWRRLLQETPLWPVTLVLAAVFCLLTVGLAGSRPGPNDFFRAIVLAPLPLLLLAVRDAALFLFFAFARQPRRAQAAALFYLLLLYWLVPMLLRSVGLQGVSDLVLPPFWERPGLASAVAAVQAGAMVAAAVWRWRKNYGS